MPERRRESRTGKAGRSLGQSTRSYSVELDEGLLAQLRDLPKSERQTIGDLIRRAQESFGQPHQHSGVGIRDLAPKGSRYRVYECRISKAVRLVFTIVDPSTLFFHMMGNHNEVQRFLKSFL
jgi:mRNA-degrading endonuclease RelE of RelBE toxin-antitoxin system